MNAVNLLPPKHRPRQATGGKEGSSFVLLGALALIVVALLVYVLSINSINDSKSQIATAKADAARANAQADALGAYGSFAQVKLQRVTAVKELAQGRADWERVMRELARVLPTGVWITNVDASDSANSASGTGGAPTPPPAGSPAAASSPQVTIEGCAPNQPAVADTLVRLRELQGASDVQLDHSTKPTDATSGSSASSGADSSTGCGKTNGVSNYDFKVIVTLEAAKPTPYVPGKVPASLGGGQ
jgi:Tfp pilus assembly protein PilN